MNIISNNCFSAVLYKDYIKCEFQNPFMWTIIDFDSMCKLMNEYENIDFNDYELIKNDNWEFFIKINDKIIVRQYHYRFNKAINGIKIIGVDVHSNKIWNYICEKYESRLKRMKDEPKFVIEFNDFLKNYNKETFEKFLEMPVKYKTVVFYNYKEYRDIKKENCLMIYDENIEKPGKDAGAYVVPTYYKKVLEFFNGKAL